jgi:hypothetical protein
MDTGIYDDHGIRFEYPSDWSAEEADDGTVTTVSVQSPSGLAFALVSIDDSRPDPSEIADQALGAMRDEYPGLDVSPALETLGSHHAVGHDIEFISLDLTNTCTIRCFRTPRRTVMVFGQWSDSEGENAELVLRAVRHSLEETDLETPSPE